MIENKGFRVLIFSKYSNKKPPFRQSGRFLRRIIAYLYIPVRKVRMTLSAKSLRFPS